MWQTDLGNLSKSVSGNGNLSVCPHLKAILRVGKSSRWSLRKCMRGKSTWRHISLWLVQLTLDFSRKRRTFRQIESALAGSQGTVGDFSHEQARICLGDVLLLGLRTRALVQTGTSGNSQWSQQKDLRSSPRPAAYFKLQLFVGGSHCHSMVTLSGYPEQGIWRCYGCPSVGAMLASLWDFYWGVCESAVSPQLSRFGAS